MFMRQAKSVVGLDVGSYSVKLAHMVQGNGGHKLLSGLEQEYQGDGQEKIAEAIRGVFHQAGLKPGQGASVVTSLSGTGTAVKQVNFPLLTDEELKSSIMWEVRKHLPFELEETVLDYQVLSRDAEAKIMAILLAAVTKGRLAEHLELLGKVGIEPQIIDLSPLAVMNAILATQYPEKDKPAVVLEHGARETTLSMFYPGGLFFTREIPISGHQMTVEIQKHLDIPYEEAERVKREGSPHGQLLDMLKKPLTQLIYEIRRSLTYYENRTGNRGFHKLYLAGGSSRLANLENYLQDNLGVPAEKLNPLRGIEVEAAQNELPEAAPWLAQAVGLALREARE